MTVPDDLAATIAALPPLGRWVYEAACAEKADIFTGPKPKPAVMAVAEITCVGCPVRRDCADYAATLGEVWGVWAGEWRDGRRRAG